MEPPLIRQRDGDVKIYTILGLAFLIWIVAVGITCVWWRGFRRVRRSADEPPAVSDVEEPSNYEGVQNIHLSPRRRSSAQRPVPPPPVYRPELRASQNSFSDQRPQEPSKINFQPGGPHMTQVPFLTFDYTNSAREQDVTHGVSGVVNEHASKSTESRQMRSCSICLRRLGSHNIERKNCGHVVHSICLKQWSLGAEQEECPVCLTLFESSPAPQLWTGYRQRVART